MIEEWRPVIGYEGLYEVSNTGRVRSLDRYDRMNRLRKGRILNLQTGTGGYLRTGLSSNGNTKGFLVHRIVAEAFIPNPDNLPEINHIDEDKSNNRVDNLEWCTRKYNVNYGSRMDKTRDTKLKNGTWFNLNDEERKIYNNEYQKKYYQEHKNEYIERRRDYRQKNKDKIKKYYQEHKNDYKEYYQENKDKISEYKREYNKKWYQEHKNDRNEQQREYYQKNRDKIIENRRKKRLEKMTIQEKVTSHNDKE